MEPLSSRGRGVKAETPTHGEGRGLLAARTEGLSPSWAEGYTRSEQMSVTVQRDQALPKADDHQPSVGGQTYNNRSRHTKPSPIRTTIAAPNATRPRRECWVRRDASSSIQSSASRSVRVRVQLLNLTSVPMFGGITNRAALVPKAQPIG